jgi:hypothetical protein
MKYIKLVYTRQYSEMNQKKSSKTGITKMVIKSKSTKITVKSALKADKGNAVVILKEEAYDDIINHMLQEGPYEVVTKIPLDLE